MIVVFDSVRKGFSKIQALRDASFEMRRAEILGFIGPNGSGKTTAVRLMLGIYAPTQGVVRVSGRNPVNDWSTLGPQIGVSLERPGLADYLTPLEYLEYFGGLFQMRPSVVKQRCEELLESFGLADRATSLLATFSKGMRQRISVARCMLNRPRLMILDEPFDGLDVESRRMILDSLSRLSAEEGTSVFVTSHNLGDVEEISDRVAVIRQGRVLAIGSMEALRDLVRKRRMLVVGLGKRYLREEIAHWMPDAEYDESNNKLLFDLDGCEGKQNQLLMRVLQAGISVESANAEVPTLEDVYLALTGNTEA